MDVYSIIGIYFVIICLLGTVAVCVLIVGGIVAFLKYLMKELRDI